MSEIREELEYFAKLAEEKEAATAESNQQKNTSGAEEGTNDSVQDTPEKTKAPKGYSKEFAENFGTLPEKWQQYLLTREEEIDKGFDTLRSRREIDKYLDDIYAKRSSELQGYGIRSQKEWLENLTKMDEMLSSHPADAMQILAKVYKLNHEPVPSASPTRQTLGQVMQGHIIEKKLNDFIAAVNDNGEKKHPFYYDVVPEMWKLLDSGLAQDIDDAYEKAVWFNHTTRDKLLAKRTQASLELKSKDAKKAKDAAFSPKGKTVVDTKDLTLREELEMRFAALMNED